MYRIKQLLLALGDLICLGIGLYLGLALRYLQWPPIISSELAGAFEYLFFAAIIISFIVGLYDISRTRNTAQFYEKVLWAAFIWIIVSVFYFYINPNTSATPKTTLLLITITGFSLIALWRFVYNKFLSTVFGTSFIAFMGYTSEVQELIEVAQNEPERGIRVLGCISQHAPSSVAQAETLKELTQKNNGVAPGFIIIAPQVVLTEQLQSELYQALFQQVSIISLAEFYESVFNRIPPFTFSTSWFITNLREQQKKIYDRFRIITDSIAALLLLVIFVVTFPIVAILIKTTSPGPLFFKQKRMGRNGTLFTIFKYRTMKSLTASGSAETAGAQYAADNDPRITTVGKLLRRTRLDELPQCLNILHGDMALIGPRPERPEFVAELASRMPFYTLRHLVKPGLFSWAALHQSYFGSIEENLFKLQYDLYYIKNRGPLLDMSIALKTIFVVLRMMGR